MQSCSAAAEQCTTIEGAYRWQPEDRTGSLAPDRISNCVAPENAHTAVNPMTLNDIAIWGTVLGSALSGAAR
jgi:hypothetical protein